MIRPLFILFITFILILFSQRPLADIKISRLKNKIKKSPFIGVKEYDGSYYYKEKGYTINYRIQESPAGTKTVEWISLKRRLTFLEKKTLEIKRGLNNFFLYQRWFTVFRPSVVIILIISLAIFYFGIMEHSLKRMRHFKWVVARISGISPESIGYTGGGWFKISGQRRSSDRVTEPVTISFNLLGWIFFPNTANVNLWSEKLKQYIIYPVSINDKGDVWLGKGGEIHGRVLGDRISWDEPLSRRVSGHHITIEDGKLKIIDE